MARDEEAEAKEAESMAASEKKPITAWVKAKNPDLWKLAAAAQAGKWELTTGYPSLTEAEFDAAIKAAEEIKIG